MLSEIEPQLEQAFELGNHRPHLTNALPARAALYSRTFASIPHPASLVALARLWFFIIPFTCKSSTAITWFSFTIRRDSLCRWSLRAQVTRACARATSWRPFARRLDPFFLRDGIRCLRFRFRSALRRWRGLSNFEPSLVTARCVSPTSTPIALPSVEMANCASECLTYGCASRRTKPNFKRLPISRLNALRAYVSRKPSRISSAVCAHRPEPSTSRSVSAFFGSW